MKRLRYPAGWWSYGLLLSLLGVLVFAVAVGALARQQPVAPAAETEASDLDGGKRRFFVTNFNATGANADAACPAGYHMASLWELHDPSSLVYASDVPAAFTRPDRGTGPVAGWWAWVRTGVDNSVANQAGQANCAVWSSNTVGQYGTIVRLADQWAAAGAAISPWQAQTWSCSGVAPVWCVSNTFDVFVPFVTR